MSTHKTRQEKIIADLKRKLAQRDTATESVSYSVRQNRFSPAFSAPYATTTYIHDHFYSDLRKTMILTSSIIGFELLFYFVF